MDRLQLPDHVRAAFAPTEAIFAKADGTPERALHSLFVAEPHKYPDMASARAGRSVKLNARPHPTGPPLRSDMGGASRLPPHNLYRQALVHDAVRGILRGTVHPEPTDPTHLYQTQSGVGISGVTHYVHNWDYWETGKPFADQHQSGNRVPIIYERTNPTQGHRERFLLSGHHRAAAALGLGVALMAHVVHAS
jgi:hypothetical protein